MDDASATIPLDDAAHLLVVDDDTRIRTLLSEYLTSNGYRITVAANAAEARRLLDGTPTSWRRFSTIPLAR